MHILYVHQNFPAQFGHIANHLVEKLGWRCTFVNETAPGTIGGIEKIQYKTAGGATKQNHFCSRTFENTVWHCDGVYRALRERGDIKPDLIVGHSGFGSTLFLRELYRDVPIINFFEYYYRAHDPDSDMDFRSDLGWPVSDLVYLRSYCRNAMILLDLQNCAAGYTPTQFQKSRFPTEYHGKIHTVFDGVDRGVYHGFGEQLRPAPAERGWRKIAGVDVSPTTRVVTYVSRGFESMRGFDIFMKAAKRIYQEYPDVLFIVVGSERMAYGGDENFIGDKKSFKEWVLAQDQYDMSKFAFVGRLNPPDLAQTLAAGDLHIYLTVPFVLSWSMMDAMSCGAVVLASATTPVKEMIQEGQNGLLADFFNVEELASKAVAVLKDPSAARALGRAAEQLITEKYSLEAVVPEMIKLYEETASRAPRQAAPVVQMEPTYANGRPAPARPTGGATDVFTGMPAAPPRRPPSKSPFFG